MKHFIGIAVLVALALVVRLWAFPRFGLDIHIHDTYYVIAPLRIIGFWLLMGVAAVWFVIAAYKFGRST
jgi:heme/copper-type cytochrome/quinol oxidase subunit 1